MSVESMRGDETLVTPVDGPTQAAEPSTAGIPSELDDDKGEDRRQRDPGDRSELQEIYRQSMSHCAGDVSGDSSGPATPLRRPDPLIDTPGLSPLPPTFVHDHDDPPDEFIPRLPHSSSSFDLRSRAITPKPDRNSNGKLGLSRIPHSAVMHAVALQPLSPSPASPSARSVSSPIPNGDGYLLGAYGYSPSSPHTHEGHLSPGPGHAQQRTKLGSAASTRVIDGLQTDLQHMRMQVEKVRQDLRSSQRVVESLTRQNEDLKDTRERLRSECDQLNNVITRKERLLQETAEKKRTAETELREVQKSRTMLEKTSKKSIQQKTAQVAEAHLAQHKAESECNSLRDAVRSLRDVWAREVKGVKEEYKRGSERERAEREEAKLTHAALQKLVISQGAERDRIQQLAQDVIKQSASVNAAYEDKLADMRAEIARHGDETRAAKDIARQLAEELVHLRRLMREPQRDEMTAISQS